MSCSPPRNRTRLAIGVEFTPELVEHMASLARLALTDEERATLASELGSILEHAGKIAELDLADVEPTYHVIPLVNVFREDEVADPPGCLDREVVLSAAPEARDGYFVVPPIRQ
jgi:aspartyl-tRNA(Asn)/glutamyl-tRNA(Gln) amidotransferase subunit C